MFPKLWKILQVFRSAFNDEWGYRLTKKYVLRFPVWDKPQSGSFGKIKINGKKIFFKLNFWRFLIYD